MRSPLRSRVPPPLTPSQIARLADRSNLSSTEIQDSYERFLCSYVYGYLSLDEFLLYLRGVHRHAGHRSFSLDKFLVKRLFRRFDRDHDEQLNFEEFLLGNLAMRHRPDEEKLIFILSLCGRGRTKYYTKQQTIAMLIDLCDLFDLSYATETRWERISGMIDRLYPGHGDNKISWKNLCRSVRQQPLLFKHFLSAEVESENEPSDTYF